MLSIYVIYLCHLSILFIYVISQAAGMFVSAIDNIKEMFDFKQKYKEEHLSGTSSGGGAGGAGGVGTTSRRSKRRTDLSSRRSSGEW